MSRTVASTSSPAGLSKTGSPEVPSGIRIPQGNGTPAWPLGRSVSTTSTVEPMMDPTRNPGGIDPDELFTRHTVSEVRKVQQRLRCVLRSRQVAVDCVRCFLPIG